MSPSTLRKFKDTELNILHTALYNQVRNDFKNRQYERLNNKEIRDQVKPLAEVKVELLKRDIPSTDKDKEHTGKGLCPIHYNKRRHSFSSTDLRKRVVEASEKK